GAHRLLVGPPRELLERPAPIGVVREVRRGELGELLLTPELARFDPEVAFVRHSLEAYAGRPGRQSGKMHPCKPTPGRTATCTNRTWGDGAEPSPPSSWTGWNCPPGSAGSTWDAAPAPCPRRSWSVPNRARSAASISPRDS